MYTVPQAAETESEPESEFEERQRTEFSTGKETFITISTIPTTSSILFRNDSLAFDKLTFSLSLQEEASTFRRVTKKLDVNYTSHRSFEKLLLNKLTQRQKWKNRYRCSYYNICNNCIFVHKTNNKRNGGEESS